MHHNFKPPDEFHTNDKIKILILRTENIGAYIYYFLEGK